MGGIFFKYVAWYRSGQVLEQVPCKFRASSVQVLPQTTSGRCPFLSNSRTSLVFTAELVEFVLGVPKFLENGQRPD
jgi:hypothetical protein